MKIGLFFGSFNPIHTGHIELVNTLLQNRKVDHVMLVVSPQNPFKNPESYFPEHLRLRWARQCFKNEKQVEVSDIEFSMPKPSYTHKTIQALRAQFPKDNFYMIMGDDLMGDLDKWKNFEYINDQITSYLVYPRLNKDTQPLESIQKKIKKIEAPIMDVSSTKIREALHLNAVKLEGLPAEIKNEVLEAYKRMKK